MRKARGAKIVPNPEWAGDSAYLELVDLGQQLADEIDHPLMREKIVAILSGKSVNH